MLTVYRCRLYGLAIGIPIAIMEFMADSRDEMVAYGYLKKSEVDLIRSHGIRCKCEHKLNENVWLVSVPSWFIEAKELYREKMRKDGQAFGDLTEVEFLLKLKPD